LALALGVGAAGGRRCSELDELSELGVSRASGYTEDRFVSGVPAEHPPAPVDLPQFSSDCVMMS